MELLHYKSYGLASNPPLVLVHGMGGSAAIFFRQIQFYKKHFHVIAIDLPGHGNSYKLDKHKPVTLDLVSNDIICLLDHLNIKNACFIGVSLGTVVIHHLINVAPERVNRAVFAGAITSVNLPSYLLLKIGGLLRRFMPYMWLYRFCARIIMPKKNHTQSRRLFIKEATRMGYSQFAKWYKVSTCVNGIYPRTKNIPVPKLYISGKEDHFLYEVVKQDVRNDKYAHFHSIANCGHVCNLDKPQEFNTLSSHFLLKNVCNQSDTMTK